MGLPPSEACVNEVVIVVFVADTVERLVGAGGGPAVSAEIVSDAILSPTMFVALREMEYVD
jgi:hypothetical protein